MKFFLEKCLVFARFYIILQAEKYVGCRKEWNQMGVRDGEGYSIRRGE